MAILQTGNRPPSVQRLKRVNGNLNMLASPATKVGLGELAGGMVTGTPLLRTPSNRLAFQPTFVADPPAAWRPAGG